MKKKVIELDNLVDVESSNIKSVGYQNGTTYVLFKNEQLYSYPETDIEIFEELINAESVGKQFSKSYRKLEKFEKLDNTELKKKNEEKEESQNRSE